MRSVRRKGTPPPTEYTEAQINAALSGAASINTRDAVGHGTATAGLRRNTRPAEVPPLPRIRSLAYFQPVIEELLENPVPEGYLQYLRFKVRTIIDKADPAAAQKSTLSDDR